jgi:Cu(I)/Ag(I) efflux system protein CusF
MKKFIIAASLILAAIVPALAATVPVAGEVKKINPDQNKITLKHEAITNLDMKPMTMVFTVADPEMLKTVAVGDKVTFEADRVKGKLTVVSITAAK